MASPMPCWGVTRVVVSPQASILVVRRVVCHTEPEDPDQDPEQSTEGLPGRCLVVREVG